MDENRTNAAMMITGGTALAIGPFLGWANLLGVSVSGIDGGDGWMALTGAVVLVVFGLRAFFGDSTLPTWFGWAGLLVAIGVAGINLLDIMSTGGDDVSLGKGMWLMVLGGLVAFIGMLRYSWPQIREYRRNRDRPQASPGEGGDRQHRRSDTP